MRSGCFQADATGRIRVMTGGRGFRIAPAVPDANAPEYAITNRPGRLPLSVRPGGTGGQRLHVSNSDSRFFETPFDELLFEGAESGDWFCVEVFESQLEGVLPSPTKAVVPVLLLPAGTAVGNGAPVANEGATLRPGMRWVTTYFAGTLTTATLYVKRLDGTWFNTAEVIDPSTGNRYDTRMIAVPGDRFVWVGGAAGMTCAVEAQMEVG